MGKGVLFVSPKREDAATLSRMLGSLSVPIEYVADLAQARSKIQNATFSVILTEARLTDGTWLEVLDLARRLSPRSEVIVTDATADARFWAEVLNMGAYDLIAQPFAAGEVQRILSNACLHAASPSRSATASR
jgi:DNA-binding NtrC family response regulator